jgi:hypothetical protein
MKNNIQFPPGFENDKNNIAIDFDGVIHCANKGWHDGTCYGEPIPGSLQAIETLSKQYISDELTPQEMEKKGLSGITNNRDGNKEFCASANEIPLSSKTTEKVYKIVKEMFHMQVKHSAKCYDIISMLFTITINPTTKKPTMFKLNENLIRKGFPELERINREARKILVEYYTKCENKYTEGMGQPADFSFVSPEAQKILQKFSCMS